MAPPPPADRPRRRPGPRSGEGQGRRGEPRAPGQNRAGRDRSDRNDNPRREDRRARDDRPRGSGSDRRSDRDRAGDRQGRSPRQPKDAGKQTGKQPPKSWGGVARRGSRNVADPPPGSAAQAWREAVARARGKEPAEQEPWEPETWVEEPDEPTDAASTERARSRRETKLPDAVRSEIASAAPRQAKRLQGRLADAARAYERDRYRDALRILRPLADAAPESATVRELLGLTLYRLGRWNQAIKQLEAFHRLTGSYDQHPTLADCYRGLKRWRRVDEVWEQLRMVSPSAELMAEGRLVVAGSLADRGDVQGAIDLLEATPGVHRTARAQEHHVRIWYALGDLYERAGELPHARELFRRVAARDAELYDVRERLANLS